MRYLVFCLALIIGIAFGRSFDDYALGEGNENIRSGNYHSFYSEDQAAGFPKAASLPKVNEALFSQRNFSHQEVRELIGKRVKNLELNAKCPLEGGNCMELNSGEIGMITGIIPSIGNTFMIEIRWYEGEMKQAGRLSSFVSRADKNFAFSLFK
jgi:hypothetical protein